MRASGMFYLAGLTAVALLSGWLYQQAAQERPVNDGRHRHDPDSFVDGIDMRTHDASGRLQHRLRAERMLHYPDDDSTELTAPYLELYRPEQPPWQVRARHGQISSGGVEVVLRQQVEIEREGSRSVRPARIDTELLHAFPDRDYAETDAPIRYRSTGLDVNSVGMRAQLDQGRVELLSQVRAVHHPQTSP